MSTNSTINEEIQVYCRLNGATQSNSFHCVKSHTSKCIYLKKKNNDSSPSETVFPIRCLDKDTSQKEVFDTVVNSQLDSVLQGYNCTILAYGQTNSGKTYTMRGGNTLDDSGIIPRSILYLLSKLSQDGILTASYIQIYGEQITDLLPSNITSLQSFNQQSLTSVPGTNYITLQIREKNGQVYIEGVNTYKIQSIEDMTTLLQIGDNNRMTYSTNMNDTSSRSHAILMIKVHQRIPTATTTTTTTTSATADADATTITTNTNNADSKSDHTTTTMSMATMSTEEIESTLVLCDLAGSERYSATQGLGYQRQEETKAINMSLSALGNCMNALAEGREHIPYRDSKLTRLLQGSLGGMARTTVIVTVLSGEDPHSETLNTLRFASRASKVKVHANIVKYVNYEKLYHDLQAQYLELQHIHPIPTTSTITTTVSQPPSLSSFLPTKNTVNIINSSYSNSNNNSSSNNISYEELMKELTQYKQQNHVLSEQIHIQSNQIDQLKQELSDLIQAQKIPTSNSSNKSTSNDNTNNGDQNDMKLNTNSESNDTICTNQACDKVKMELIQAHKTEMKTYKQQVQIKYERYDQRINTLNEEILDLYSQQKQSQQHHLQSIQELSQTKTQLRNLEMEFEQRLGELLPDLDMKNNIIDELREDIDNLMTTMEKMNIQKKQLDHENQQLVAKMTKMEELFMNTVTQLSNRIDDLEQTSYSSSSSSRYHAMSNTSTSNNSSSNTGYSLNNTNNNNNNNMIMSSKHPLKKALKYQQTTTTTTTKQQPHTYHT